MSSPIKRAEHLVKYATPDDIRFFDLCSLVDLARAAERATLVHSDGCNCDLCVAVAEVTGEEENE